ncbi:uncharacterized protein TRIADDRAFT_59529 [Trichoplax adhaerens]|uniref:EGF-like domain-containing protein n=1 Tax=Trichoplax adhaerens TaxID=10228 RepID=B3S5W3_TRIAD|nr:predicted protein [Trichoplax adhaerens]EDV21876.1 predicted protein [Trichoplax adhaerens]|eukprot:XP_002115513.1 predicted protein [Trichoplax adhaerens]
MYKGRKIYELNSSDVTLLIVLAISRYSIADPCKAYEKLIDSSTSINRLLFTSSPKAFQCDKALNNNWYRFTGGKDSQVLPESCSKQYGRCLTLSSGWMVKEHPADYCRPNPCFNNGSCQIWANGYVCRYPCIDSLILNATSRLIGHSDSADDSNSILCDKVNFSPAWYHLQNHSKSVMLVTHPVEMLQCHTISTGWLNGNHPTECQVAKRYCADKANKCDPNPCVYGNCTISEDDYVCHCQSGYTGIKCDQDIDECMIKNGGCNRLCTNTHGSYFCSCPGNFELQDDLRGCIDPCKNGTVGLHSRTRDLIPDFNHISDLVNRCNTIQDNAVKWYRIKRQIKCFPIAKRLYNARDFRDVDGDNIHKFNVCFHFGFPLCSSAKVIKVKHCSGYDAYKIDSMSACYLSHCGILTDPCSSNPCVNGRCSLQPGGDYLCNCSSSYTGRHCEQG